MPVVIVPTAKTSPTPTQKASSPRRLSRSALIVVDWMNCTHGLESLKESKAVLPNSTATTPSSPGLTATVSRLASGERMRRRPSRRPHTESLAASVE